MEKTRIRRHTAWCSCLGAIVLGLAACGGGGGGGTAIPISPAGGGGTTTPPVTQGPEPTAENSSSFAVTGKETVINGIAVPPPPIDSANASVAGVDTNANGVRDDVERIAATYFKDSGQFAGGMNVAKRVQEILAQDKVDVAATQQVVDAAVEESRCLAAKYFGGDYAAAARAIKVMVTAELNTNARIEHYRSRVGQTSSVIGVDVGRACS